jgi:hypothetical protein
VAKAIFCWGVKSVVVVVAGWLVDCSLRELAHLSQPLGGLAAAAALIAMRRSPDSVVRRPDAELVKAHAARRVDVELAEFGSSALGGDQLPTAQP